MGEEERSRVFFFISTGRKVCIRFCILGGDFVIINERAAARAATVSTNLRWGRAGEYSVASLLRCTEVDGIVGDLHFD